MRIVATGMLVAMAATYVATRVVGDVHPAIGYIRAFAEAAMVGGLADWFAVTALFRHPLGLPIPHTAIIPRNKDRIGDTLALFLRDNFLTPVVIARRMKRLDVAAGLARLLTDRPSGGVPGGAGVARVAADLLGALDQRQVGGLVKNAIVGRLREAEPGPLLGRGLGAAMAEGRHLPVLDAGLRWLDGVLSSNDTVIREMVHARAGALLRWTGLDETIATRLIDGLKGMIADVAADPGHRLRLKLDDALNRLVIDLQFDPVTQAKVARMRDGLLENPALGEWLEGLWESFRAMALRAARDPDAVMAGKMGDALRQFGLTVAENPALRLTINRVARRIAVGLAARYGSGIVRLVSDTVRGWDAGTITARLEQAVGRDLQYIRVNGTIVGGLVGLVIHAIGHLT